MNSVVIQSHDSAKCSDQEMVQRTSSRDENTGDIRSIIMKKLSVVPCIGLIMAFLSGIFFAAASFTVELIPEVDVAFIVTTRSVVQLVFYLPLSLYFKEPLHGVDGERFALLERSVTGYAVFALSYYSLSYISLSDSSAISFSAPVFTSVIAFFMLKEPCGIFQVVTIITTLIGVFMIARPSFLFPQDFQDVFTVQQRVTGAILSILTCLSMSYTYISMRKLPKTPSNTVIVVFSIFSIFAGSLNINISSFTSGKLVRIPETGFQWAMIAVNGVCGVLNQATLVLSLKFETAGLVALLRTFDIVIAFVFQAAFLNQPIHWTSIAGSVIVTAGCVAVAIKKYWASKSDDFSKENDVIHVKDTE